MYLSPGNVFASTAPPSNSYALLPSVVWLYWLGTWKKHPHPASKNSIPAMPRCFPQKLFRLPTDQGKCEKWSLQ